ncbi:MAG: ABC transporter permease [Clostridia bacterium]|nr:ABC transporter permease [Clostridia bacterium]MBO4886077.1 ABC transporter permease [Clostridia bacterium]MBR4442455.1 ABC transporter permease [Clostridia bacterium]
MKNEKTLSAKKPGGFSLLSFVIEHREIPLMAVLVALLAGVSIAVPGYFASNYMNILKNCSMNLVMASGMLCVLLVGSIDISVAAVLELAAAIAGMLMRDGKISSMIGMFAIGIAIGALIGFFNGTVMSFGRVLPIIVTLGMTYLARALIPMDFILGMNKIARIDLTDYFSEFILHEYLGIPVIVYIAAAVVLLMGLFLKYTPVGRSIYATGSNEEAAEMRGVKVKWIKVLAHVLCGALAGMAGIMRLGYYNAIEKGAANGQEMYVIAACVLGGVSVMGGYGKITGVIIGALLIATIDSAIPQLFMNATMMKEFFKGILILLAILLNVMMQRAANKRNLKGRNI